MLNLIEVGEDGISSKKFFFRQDSTFHSFSIFNIVKKVNF